MPEVCLFGLFIWEGLLPGKGQLFLFQRDGGGIAISVGSSGVHFILMGQRILEVRLHVTKLGEETSS